MQASHFAKCERGSTPAMLLAAWLSFSMSEIRALTKSRSISGDYIKIVEVIVDIGGRPVRKEMAKNLTRNRTYHNHHI